MKNHHRLLLVLITIHFAGHLTAHNLRQISSRDGLSNSSVYCLFQDDERFLWIGTFDGLNMYDGRNITIYKPDINNQHSLSSNVIRSIIETNNRHLWISTKWGLNKFSQQENQITAYYNEFKEDVHLVKDNSDNLYVLGHQGMLSWYDEAHHTFVDLPINPEVTCRNTTSLLIDANDTIWINHKGTLERYTVSFGKQCQPIVTRHADYPHRCAIEFMSFSRGRFLFVDVQGGLYSINPRRTVFIRDISTLLRQNGTISSIIYNYTDVLIGFRTNGLILLHSQEEYREEKIEINCGVFSLWKDEEQDIIWIGTDGQGVYAWIKDDYTFNNLMLNQLPIQKQRPVRAVYSDPQQNLWLGTKDNGVIRIRNYNTLKDYPEEKVVHFTTENGLTNNGVFAFAPSKAANVLWIGSDGPGLNYYNYNDHKVYTLLDRESHLTSYVHTLTEAPDSTLWVGAGSTLVKVKVGREGNQLKATNTRQFTFKLKNNQPFNQVYSLCYENDSTIWVGMRGNGLIRFNPRTNKYQLISFEEKGIAPMNDVLCIFQDKNKTLWLGTSYGIIRFTMYADGTYDYKNFNENNGLPNNTIHGILEAPDNKLWLSSNTGIILFDPVIGTFRNFNQKTGLKVIEYSDNAYYSDPNAAVFFFGGVDGLTWIHKEEIERKRYIPTIQFTGLRIFNQEYNIHHFEKQEESEPYIELKYKQNYFSVSFVAMDFVNGANSSYSYRLENFSHVWMDTRSNEAQFTNIPPGAYNLQVKYNDGTGDNEDQMESIRIVILPPWYQTLYARIGYVLLAMGSLFLLFYVVRRKYEVRKQKMNRQLKEKYKEEMYENKLRFFTNITHEFSTPLTLIYGPCERILAHPSIDGPVRKYAQIIKSNAERLNTLIQEIIDFRRMETGHKKLKIEQVNMSLLTQDIARSFVELAERNNIFFRQEIAPDVMWNTDTGGYTKIISNLISNAFKYTPPQGRICVSMQTEGQWLVLRMHNTGKGIEKKNLPLIFNRYRVLDNVEENSIKGLSSRNGLGLAICHSLTELLQGTIEVESELNQYTEFTLRLPRLEVEVQSAPDSLPATPRIAPVPTHLFITQPEAPAASPQEAGVTKEKILIIDDNKDLLWMLQEILSEEYRICLAENGKEGLELLKKESPDLIITDIMMPEIDGITLTRQIKSNKHTMHIPLVILSAKNSHEEKTIGIESGADAYIAKPFHADYLKAVIRHQIKSKKDLEQYYNSSASAFHFNDGKLMQKEDKDFLQTATDIINRNMENTEFSPDEMAAEMMISTRNLYRKLKELNQPTPNELIKEVRMTYAARLLVTTTLTIQEVMYRTGFGNRSHFHREFSKRYAKPPKEYRESNKLKDESL